MQFSQKGCIERSFRAPNRGKPEASRLSEPA